jgi:hypothetical protein
VLRFPTAPALALALGSASCSLDGLTGGGAGGGGGDGAIGGSGAGLTSGGAAGDGGQAGSAGSGGGAPATEFEWIHGLGNETDQGTIGSGDTSSISLASSPTEIAFAAAVRSGLDFGGGVVGAPGASNVLFARYASDGALLGSGALTGSAVDRSLGAIAVSPSGRMVLVGHFGDGALDVEGGGEIANSATSRDDGFIALYDPNGVLIASRRLAGSESTTHQRIQAVTFDDADGVIVAGNFEGDLDPYDKSGAKDTGCALTGDTSLSFDAYLARFGPDLDCQWAKAYGSADDSVYDDLILSVAYAAGDRIVVGGAFRATMTIGASILTSSGNEDGFVAAFEGDGTPDWAIGFGKGAGDRVRSVAVGQAGDVFFAGYGQGSLAPDGCDPVSTSLRDAVIGRLEPADGQCSWFTALGGGGTDDARAVAVSPNAVFATGFFAQSITFADQPIASNGSEDVFVVSVDPLTGGIARGWALGSVGVDTGEALAISGGSAVASGTYAAAFDLLPPALQPEDFFLGRLTAD